MKYCKLRKQIERLLISLVISEIITFDLGPVPSKDMQTPVFQKDAHSAESVLIFWVMADCIYNLWWHTKCVTKFTGKMRIAREFFFVQLLFFEIWLILRYVTLCIQRI